MVPNPMHLQGLWITSAVAKGSSHIQDISWLYLNILPLHAEVTAQNKLQHPNTSPRFLDIQN